MGCISTVRVGRSGVLASCWLIKMPERPHLVKTDSFFSHKNVCSHHSVRCRLRKKGKRDRKKSSQFGVDVQNSSVACCLIRCNVHLTFLSSRFLFSITVSKKKYIYLTGNTCLWYSSPENRKDKDRHTHSHPSPHPALSQPPLSVSHTPHAKTRVVY